MDVLRRLGRRRWVAVGLIALGSVGIMSIVGTLLIMFVGQEDLDNRITNEGVFATGIGVLLALVGGAVALAAFADATRRPELKLSLRSTSTASGNIAFHTRESVSSGGMRMRLISNQALAPALLSARLENSSNFPARYPSIRLEFVGILPRQRQRDWHEVPVEASGDFALQWDGINVLGEWNREPPQINLDGAFVTSSTPQILSQYTAEEFRPVKASHSVRID